jgi:hypothetical protein
MAQFTKGLQNRIGTDAKPSWPLLDRHVSFFDRFFESQYDLSVTTADKHYWAAAGLCNLFLWLGWLRSKELFGIRWKDIDYINPSRGPEYDLPTRVGCLLLRLNEETKSSRSQTADVPIAYATHSGYKPGRWYERLRRYRGSQQPVETDATYVFTCNGRLWDSRYYRHTFVYPLLHVIQREGDPYLSRLVGGDNPGLTIELVFKGLHMYRRGAHTHVEVVRDPGTQRRKATQPERYEHARWSRRRSGEEIHVMYRQWSLYDRLKITLFCH